MSLPLICAILSKHRSTQASLFHLSNSCVVIFLRCSASPRRTLARTFVRAYENQLAIHSTRARAESVDRRPGIFYFGFLVFPYRCFFCFFFYVVVDRSAVAGAPQHCLQCDTAH